jgi:hypothetical protein
MSAALTTRPFPFAQWPEYQLQHAGTKGLLQQRAKLRLSAAGSAWGNIDAKVVRPVPANETAVARCATCRELSSFESVFPD